MPQNKGESEFMDFKEAINAFKVSGDRTIINDIMVAVEKDFMGNSTRERVNDGTDRGGIRINLNHDYEYVAYSIRAMRELLMRHVSLEHGFNPLYVNEFQRLLSVIRIDFRIDFKGTIYDKDEWIYYYNLTPELFADLEKRMQEIEENLYEDDLRNFKRLFSALKDIEAAKREGITARKQELEESAIKALEYALKYVDTSKSEKEIVKYINITFRSKLADDEIKRNGMRRIQRKWGDKRTSFVVKPYFPKNSHCVILGRKINESLLTAGQRDFIRDVVAIIDADRENGNVADYTCDTYGEVRISKKYIAGRLGMREDLVRKKLERIKKKLS